MEDEGPKYPRRTRLFDVVKDPNPPPQLETLSNQAEKDRIIARFDVGGVKFTTALSTLLKRDRGSWLAAWAQKFITWTAQNHECEEVVINRDGNLFRYILNWLRDGVVIPDLEMPTYMSLLEEAEYFKLAGLVVAINWMLRETRDNVDVKSVRSEMSRQDFIKLLHYGGGLKLRGVNLSGLNLSNMDLRGADLRRARLINTNFENADLRNANFEECEATGANFRMARLESCKFTGITMYLVARTTLFVNLQRSYCAGQVAFQIFNGFID